MAIQRLQAVAVIHNNQASVAPEPFGVNYDPVSGSVHRRAECSRKIHSSMNRAFTRERIGSGSEGAQQTALHRPQAGSNVGLPLFRVRAVELGYVGGLKEVVLVE